MAVNDSIANPANGDQLDDGFFADIVNIPLTQIGLNHIRTLFDRAGVYSKGLFDGWGEGYYNTNGINSSVTIADNNYLGFNSTDQTYFPGDFTGSTLSSANLADASADDYGGVKIAITNDDTVAKKIVNIRAYGTGGAGTARLYFLEGVSGSRTIDTKDVVSGNGINTWDVSDLNICIKPSQTITVFIDVLTNTTYYGTIGSITSASLNNTTIKTSTYTGTTAGLRYYSGAGGTFAPIDIIDDDGGASTNSTEITHTIPTGTFGTAISSAFLTPFINSYEAGINVQYKLTNTGGDDSGWLNYNLVTEFTAFSNGEPDTLIVKLIPKSSSPTAGYPAIKGVWVKAQ